MANAPNERSTLRERPFRVEYECDYRQRATTHATQAGALAAATEAIAAAKNNRRPEAFISNRSVGGWVTVDAAGPRGPFPEWWEESE